MAEGGESPREARPGWVFLAYLGLLAWVGSRRLAGLGPPALGQDDLWVGFVVKYASLPELFTYEAPIPMGFVAAEQLVSPASTNPELGLQIVPFLCGLALLPLAGWAASRISGRTEVGLLAALLVALHPEAGAYAVRVKQFTWDATTMLALLAVGVPHMDPERPARPANLALAAGVALLFSFNTIFLGLMLVHVRALMSVGERATRGRAILAAVAYDLFALALYRYRLDAQSADWVVRYWQKRFAFPPEPAWLAGIDFGWLVGAGSRAYGRWLAQGLRALVVFLPLGLGSLFLYRRTRWLGLTLTGVGVGLPLAGLLHVYPVGGGRTDYFYQPILAVLAAVGVGALALGFAAVAVRLGVTETRAKLISTLLPLAGALALFAAEPWPHAKYGNGTMTTEVKDLIAWTDAQARPDDLILLTRPSRWNLGFYTALPLVSNFGPPEGKLFDFETTRPRSRVIDNIPRTLEADDLPDRIVFLGLLEGQKRLKTFRQAFRRAGWTLESQRLGRNDGSAVITFVRPSTDQP